MTDQTPFILAFGDNVVDCYRDSGLMYPGGNCLNHAVYARRFGATTAYAGAVSDDAAGRAIRDALMAEGVDISLLRMVPGQTAYCVIENEAGERHFIGANLGVSIIAPSDADLQRMAQADAVHTGRSSHIDAWLETIAGLTKVSYDFATIRDADRIATIAPHCFLAGFSGGDLDREGAIHLARMAHAQGAVWAIVTRGEDGAVLYGPSGLVEAPAEPVDPLDTLGAGDTFIARCLVGLLGQEPPADFLRAASRAAAETCLSPGAFGHGVPLAVDTGTAMGIDEIYATTKPVAGPDSRKTSNPD